MINQYQKIDEVIDKEDYLGLLDQDGWETLELTVMTDYPKIGKLILDRIGQREKGLV